VPTRKEDNDDEREARTDATIERYRGVLKRADEAMERSKAAKERALRVMADYARSRKARKHG